MRFHVRCQIFLGLFFFLELSQGEEKTPEELALFMQKNVEHLIEKILFQVQEYYHEIKSTAKCIPDYIPDNIMETLKKSIDCVSENERNYANGKIKRRTHTKNFLSCFSKAKKEVNETMMAIDPYEDYCPENMTERAYEIKVMTTFTKTFQINIKNGLEVMHKEIDFSKGHCLDHTLDAVYNNSNNDYSSSIYGRGNDTNSDGIDDDRNHENKHDDDYNHENKDDIESNLDNKDDDDSNHENKDDDDSNHESKHDNKNEDNYGNEDKDDENSNQENEHEDESKQDSEPESDDISDLKNEQDSDGDHEKEPGSIKDDENGQDNNVIAISDSSNNEESTENGSNPEEDSTKGYSFDDADKPNGFNSNNYRNLSQSEVHNNNSQPSEGISRNNTDNDNTGKKKVFPNIQNKNQVSDFFRDYKKLQEDDKYYNRKNPDLFDYVNFEGQ